MDSTDSHVRPWTKSFMMRNGPMVKACRFFRRDESKLPNSIDELIDRMDESGVGGAMISGQDMHATKNASFEHHALRNAALAGVAKSRDRLVPFAGVDPPRTPTLPES